MEERNIDRHDPLITQALRQASVYRKHAVVRARPAQPGEVVHTILASGVEETINIAQEGDWVIINLQQETYLMHKDRFLSRYEATKDPERFTAIGHCRAIPNPFGMPIVMLASWGTYMRGGADCMIADTCAADGGNLGHEPYIIAKAVFDAEMEVCGKQKDSLK